MEKLVLPSISYHDTLLERLADLDYAFAYLEAVIDDAQNDDAPLRKKLILSAVKDVIEAQTRKKPGKNRA